MKKPKPKKKTDNVNHPSHYGGVDNPYEAIKVLEARMTKEEVIGFLKASVSTLITIEQSIKGTNQKIMKRDCGISNV